MLRDERRLVTAVFADISGFSELTNRLDPEQLLEVIDPVVAALSNVVGRYEGVIEKFAGDALMALFGAPVAHDDDAVRALHVALDMHAELARMVALLPSHAAGLRLHVGVNSGHGIGRVIGSEVRFDYGVLGDVVVLAQRLEAAAPTGETYVGETTHRLAGKEFDFEPVGRLTVKGRDTPVPAWRLIGPRARHFPTATRASHRRRLAGRDGELSSVLEFAGRLDDGRGGAVFVLGEPGLGKTALCEAARGHAADRGWDWLHARCLSYGRSLAYWPIADLVRRILGITDAGSDGAMAELRAALAAMGLEDAEPFIATLCGVSDATPAGLAPQTLQARVHESVVSLLRARTASHPLILHLDDLHWADPSTVALLRDLLAVTAGMPLLLLASARPAGEGTVDELRGRLPGSSLRLRLEPLGAAAVGAIAEQILGSPPASSLVGALLEHTGGNPFFVEEVTRALVERGSLVKRRGGWQTTAAWDGHHVPVTLEGVVAARVDALSEAERAALDVLSVVGRRADLRLARAVSPAVDASLPALVAAGLLDPAGDGGTHIAFHHPLTQQVVYSRLLRRRRSELHRGVGEAAERLLGAGDSSVDLLARHFALGDQPARAFPYLLRAAARAERLFANDQAADLLRMAIDLEEAATGERSQRPELLLRCAQAEEVRGGYERALAGFDDVWATTGRVRAAIGRASTLRKLGRYAEALQAVAAVRAGDRRATGEDAAGLALEEGWTRSLTGDLPGSIATLTAGLSELGDRNPRMEGRLLVHLARVEQYTGAFAAAIDHAEKALATFEVEEDLAELASTLRVLGGLYQEADAGPDGMRRAHDTLRRALAIARRVGNAEESAACLVNLGRVLWDMGQCEEALESDRESIEAFESVGLRAGVACGYCNLAEHLCELERWEEALAAARQGLDAATAIGHDMWASGALIGISDALLALGRPEEALVAAGEAVERGVASRDPGREAAARGRVASARAAIRRPASP